MKRQIKTNKIMLALVGFLIAAIPVFTFLEMLYTGNRTVFFSTLCTAAIGIITFLVLGKIFADKYIIRHLLVVIYGLTYVFWMLLSQHTVIFACSYIACSIVVVYHDKKFTTYALATVFLVNTALFFTRLYLGLSSKMIVLTQMVINVLFVLTYAYTNRLQRLYTIEDEKEIKQGIQEQEQQMMQLLDTSKAVENSVGKSREFAVHLRDQIQQSTLATQDIADSTLHTAQSVQEQTQLTSDIQQLIQQINVASERVKDFVTTSVSSSNQGQIYMNELQDSTEIIVRESNELNEEMQYLSKEIVNMKGITETISSISSSTNLLALNASIEAARAGEVGKGFAVVADEIRKLSDETRTSAENIAQVLEDFIDKIEKMVQSVDNTTDTIHKNSEIMDKANTSFESIAADLVHTNKEVEILHANCVNLQENNTKIVDQISNLSAMTEEVSAQAGNSKVMQNTCLEESQKITDELEQLVTYVLK